jgi:hypothetical protein
VPRVGTRWLTLAVRSGAFVDEETGSTWTIAGAAVAGPLDGRRLEVAITLDSFWITWAVFHQETAIYRAA